jgi:hypothetical protein
MMRFVLLVALAAIGCARRPDGEPPAGPIAVAVVVSDPGASPAADPAAEGKAAVVRPTPIPTIAARPEERPLPEPPAPSPGFEYPADLAGRVVARAVAPDLPALPSPERFGRSPKPRPIPGRLLDPEATPPVRHTLPPVWPSPAGRVRPLPPRERVPIDLGSGAEAVPARPTFPIAAGIDTRAPDVGKPPALPRLGRPFSERESLDDPAADLGHAAITGPPIRVKPDPAVFLRVTLPDPFELAEQVRPKVPPAAEPGLVPVVVNPQRTK